MEGRGSLRGNEWLCGQRTARQRTQAGTRDKCSQHLHFAFFRAPAQEKCKVQHGSFFLYFAFFLRAMKFRSVFFFFLVWLFLTSLLQHAPAPLQIALLAEARKLTASKEILLWMTPSEAPWALQASECSELLDPLRASCWISAQH